MKTIATFILLCCLFCGLNAQNIQQGWIITATDQKDYVGTTLSNGGIGITPGKEPFSIQQVMLNHVFDKAGENGISNVLRGVNPFILSMNIDGKAITADNISNWKQVIDMKTATFTSYFTVDGNAQIEYSVCALRQLPYCGLIRVKINALKDIYVEAVNTSEVPGDYMSSASTLRKMPENQIVLRTSAISGQKCQEVAASSSFICPPEVFTVKQGNGALSLTGSIKKGETRSFALTGSICSTHDFSDPHGESERQAVYAFHEGTDRLSMIHCKLWDDLWQSDIIIEGDDEAQRHVRFSLYNLYSLCREGSNLSIPPMGLSSQKFYGHIFWDSEIWMFPPLLLMNQGIAESMLNYRINRLPAAKQKAYLHGYRGAMFPWESDDSGHEATPTGELTGPFEHHITADIAIACWNYYSVTGDKLWLKEKGFPLMKEVAIFWSDRVEKNADGTYSIVNVTGADEWANNVTDNAFTNGATIRALEYAVKAAKVCGENAPAEWSEIAKNICIHSFEDGTTKNYKTYTGQTTKQADVNLLGYPLGIITDPKILKKDLSYYAEKIETTGPAMSYSILCIQHARMGEVKEATKLFDQCYKPNLCPPFGVLGEYPGSTVPYFATGAGGMLQAVINGFGGLEITEKGIIQLSSVLPPHWKKLTIKGVGKEKKTFVRENK